MLKLEQMINFRKLFSYLYLLLYNFIVNVHCGLVTLYLPVLLPMFLADLSVVVVVLIALAIAFIILTVGIVLLRRSVH